MTMVFEPLSSIQWSASEGGDYLPCRYCKQIVASVSQIIFAELVLTDTRPHALKHWSRFTLRYDGRARFGICLLLNMALVSPPTGPKRPCTISVGGDFQVLHWTTFLFFSPFFSLSTSLRFFPLISSQ